MATNVLLSAFIGSKNLGDEAIFESILANLEFGKATVTALSVDPERTRSKGVHAVYAKNPFKVFQAIRQSDIIIMGGGGIIQDQSSILNMFYYLFQLFIAKWTSTRVVLAFVGVGPLNYRLSRWLLKKVSSIILLATVRDEASESLLREVCGEKLIIKTYHDPVLNYPIDKIPNTPTDSTTIAVSLRQWYFSLPLLPASIARKLNALGFRSRRYSELVAGLAKNFDHYLTHNSSDKLQFVSFYDSEDQQMINDVLGKMKNTDRCIKPTNNLTTNEYLRLLANSKFLFGIRLHSIILATVASKAFIPVDYSSKVKSFTESVGQVDVMVAIADYDTLTFYDKMSEVNKTRKTRQKLIETQQRKMRTKNLEAFRLISSEIAKCSE